jgi:hypothetical protein
LPTFATLCGFYFLSQTFMAATLAEFDSKIKFRTRALAPPRATGTATTSPAFLLPLPSAPPRRRRRQRSPGEARPTPAAAALLSPRRGGPVGALPPMAAVHFGRHRSGDAARGRARRGPGGGGFPAVTSPSSGRPGPRWAWAGPDGLGRAWMPCLQGLSGGDGDD